MRTEATILLVDNHEGRRAGLRELLGKGQCYNLIEAGSAAEALARVDDTPELDLILLEADLPNRGGTELCRQLKRSSQTEHIRIVLVSAVATGDSHIAEGLNAGSDGYLTHPIEPDALRAWVRATLRIRLLEKALRGKESVPLKDEIELLRYFSRLSHAVNNPLQSLIATADLLGMDLEDNLVAMQALETILDLADRVARLVGEASQMAKRHMATLE